MISFCTSGDNRTNSAENPLTRTVKSHGANRMINVHVSTTEQSGGFPFLSFRTIQGSATGLRGKSAVMRQVKSEFNGF